jgi:hypothetical protein
VGEEFGEEGARAGEGGADYGDVAFDGGPFCGADVVVCVVGWLVRLWFLEGMGTMGLEGDRYSQVGSVELEITRRLLRRRTLVIKTLEGTVSH